eukprot:scpid78624/ scgid10805/ 
MAGQLRLIVLVALIGVVHATKKCTLPDLSDYQFDNVVYSKTHLRANFTPTASEFVEGSEMNFHCKYNFYKPYLTATSKCKEGEWKWLGSNGKTTNKNGCKKYEKCVVTEDRLKRDYFYDVQQSEKIRIVGETLNHGRTRTMGVICKADQQRRTVTVRCDNTNVKIDGIHGACKMVKQCLAYQMHGLNLPATPVGSSTELRCQDGYTPTSVRTQQDTTNYNNTFKAFVQCTSDDTYNNGFTIRRRLCFKGNKCERKSIANGHLPETSFSHSTAAICNVGFEATGATVKCVHLYGWANVRSALCERKCAANGVYPAMIEGEANRAPVCGNLTSIPGVTIQCRHSLFLVQKNGLRYSGPLCRPHQTEEFELNAPPHGVFISSSFIALRTAGNMDEATSLCRDYAVAPNVNTVFEIQWYMYKPWLNMRTNVDTLLDDYLEMMNKNHTIVPVHYSWGDDSHPASTKGWAKYSTNGFEELDSLSTGDQITVLCSTLRKK